MNDVVLDCPKYFVEFQIFDGPSDKLPDPLMQIEQPGHQGWVRPNQAGHRSHIQCASAKRLASGSQFVAGERYRSPVTGCARPSMHQVRVIDNQDMGREFCSTMVHRPQPCIGVEADHDTIGTHGTRQHARETFLTSRHPNFVEPDLS